MLKRIAPTPEQSYYLRRIGRGALAAETIPPSVLAFLVQQQLIVLRSTIGGEEMAELSATGCLEASNDQ